MAKAPKVEIEGRELTNILAVNYGIEATVDRDGAPTKGLVSHGITVRRIADDNTDVTNWAASAGETNRRGGTITFRNEDEVEMKKLAWGNAYVRDYRVEYSTNGDHVEEVFLIEPEYIELAGDSHDFNWKDV
jgi:hypothetical protein